MRIVLWACSKCLRLAKFSKVYCVIGISLLLLIFFLVNCNYDCSDVGNYFQKILKYSCISNMK